MADDAPVLNTLTTTTKGHSIVEGDVPEALRRRYFVDGRGGAGLGFYADAKISTPAFRDRGRHLMAERSDPNTIRDMTTIAQHRGWTIVMARGSSSFRREAWLAGRAAGIEVRGYRPTERDVQELDRRIDRRIVAGSRRQPPRERRSDSDHADREPPPARGSRPGWNAARGLSQSRHHSDPPSLRQTDVGSGGGKSKSWPSPSARLSM